jgi:hypothetical protein
VAASYSLLRQACLYPTNASQHPSDANAITLPQRASRAVPHPTFDFGSTCEPACTGPPLPAQPLTNYIVDQYLICASVPSRMFKPRVRFARDRGNGWRSGSDFEWAVKSEYGRHLATIPYLTNASLGCLRQFQFARVALPQTLDSLDESCFTAT